MMLCMEASHGPCSANAAAHHSDPDKSACALEFTAHETCILLAYPSSPSCGFRLLAPLVSLPPLACPAMKFCKLSCGCDCFQDAPQQFDTKREYVYQSELYGLEGRPLDPLARHHLPNHPGGDASSSGKVESGGVHYGPQWGLLTLSQPITASEVSCCMAAHHMLRLPRSATYMCLRCCSIMSHKLGVSFWDTACFSQ